MRRTICFSPSLVTPFWNAVKQFKKKSRKFSHNVSLLPSLQRFEPETSHIWSGNATLHYRHNCTGVLRYGSCFGRHLLIHLCNIKETTPEIQVFWYVMPCRLVTTYGHFQERCVFVLRVKQSKKCRLFSCKLTWRDVAEDFICSNTALGTLFIIQYSVWRQVQTFL